MKTYIKDTKPIQPLEIIGRLKGDLWLSHKSLPDKIQGDLETKSEEMVGDTRELLNAQTDVDTVTEYVYNSSNGKPDPIQGLGKEVV